MRPYAVDFQIDALQAMAAAEEGNVAKPTFIAK